MNFHSCYKYFFVILCIVNSVYTNTSNNFTSSEAQKIKNDALEMNSVVALKQAHPQVPNLMPTQNDPGSYFIPDVHPRQSIREYRLPWMNIFRVQPPYAGRPMLMIPTAKPMHHIIKRNKRSLDMSLPIGPEQYGVAISRSIGPILLSTHDQAEKAANQKRESSPPQIKLFCRPVGNTNFGAHTITQRATLHISVDPNATEDASETNDQINLTNFTIYLEDPDSPSAHNYKLSSPFVNENLNRNLYQQVSAVNFENRKQKFLEKKIPIEILQQNNLQFPAVSIENLKLLGKKLPVEIPQQNNLQFPAVNVENLKQNFLGKKISFEIPQQNNLQFARPSANASMKSIAQKFYSNNDENPRLTFPSKQFRTGYDARTSPIENGSIKKLNNATSKVLKGYLKSKPTPNSDDYKPVSVHWKLPVGDSYGQSVPNPPFPALDAPLDEYQQALDRLPSQLINSNTNLSPESKVQVWGYSNHFLIPADAQSVGKQNIPLNNKLEAEIKIDRTSNKKRVVDDAAIFYKNKDDVAINSSQTFLNPENIPFESETPSQKCTGNCHQEPGVDKDNFETENQSEWLRNIQKQYYPYWPFYYVYPKMTDDYGDTLTEEGEINNENDETKI